MFDDQGGAGYPSAPLGIYAGSRVLEINPTTKEIVWQYTAQHSGLPPWTFFSSFVSNAQRLPNGNIWITEGMNGRLFQVTPIGKVAWEYYSRTFGFDASDKPEVNETTKKGAHRVNRTYLVYRSQAVPDNWLPEKLKRDPVKAIDKSDL